MEDALEAGIDITNPSEKTGAWIESWMDENEDSVSGPSGRGSSAYGGAFIEQEKSNLATHLKVNRGEQARLERNKNAVINKIQAELGKGKYKPDSPELAPLYEELAKAEQAIKDFKAQGMVDKYNFSQFSQAMGGSVNPFKVLKR